MSKQARNPKTRQAGFFHRTLILAAMTLPGCSALDFFSDPAPPATLVKITFEANDQLNMNPEGKATPMVARYYELKSADGFSNADFFALYDKDKDVLGGDIVYRKELELVPNSTKEVQLKPTGESRFIGVFGAFRDLQTAQWRAIRKIPTNKTTAMIVHFSKNSVSISVPDAEPKAQ